MRSPLSDAHSSTTDSSSIPINAAMPPSPSATAAAISSARLPTNFKPSSKLNTSAATRAANSPRLWPAIATGIGKPFSRRQRQTAISAVNISGWVTRVSPSASAGPVCASVQRSLPSTSAHSAKDAPTTGNSADKSASMPTLCDPCPGKTTENVTS